MDSLVGTGSVNPTEDLTLNVEEQPRHTRTLDVLSKQRDENERPVHLEVSQAHVKELRQNLVYLTGEVTNLANKVHPLAAITELAWRRIPGAKGVGGGGEIDVELDNLGKKPDPNKPVAPERVLNALEAYVNYKPLVEKRMD